MKRVAVVHGRLSLPTFSIVVVLLAFIATTLVDVVASKPSRQDDIMCKLVLYRYATIKCAVPSSCRDSVISSLEDTAPIRCDTTNGTHIECIEKLLNTPPDLSYLPASLDAVCCGFAGATMPCASVCSHNLRTPTLKAADKLHRVTFHCTDHESEENLKVIRCLHAARRIGPRPSENC